MVVLLPRCEFGVFLFDCKAETMVGWQFQRFRLGSYRDGHKFAPVSLPAA
jgi:hypothetical protein